MGASLRVGIGGFGAIGGRVARALDDGVLGLDLVAVAARDKARAEATLQDFKRPVPVCSLNALAGFADVVVECAPAAAFDRVALPTVEAGRILMVLSSTALLERGDLIARAAETGARILVPSGAVLGLDALRATAEGTIHAVTHITRKPPKSLAGAPYLAAQGISLDGLNSPLQVFAGPVREGARRFPANVNVSAAVSLAGIGPDRTRLEIWADPALERNTHEVTVEADSARFTVKIEGLPAPDNPRTGLLTPNSVIATLRGLTAPLRVGG